MAKGRPRKVTLHEWELAMIEDALSRFVDVKVNPHWSDTLGWEFKRLYGRLQLKLANARKGSKEPQV